MTLCRDCAHIQPSDKLADFSTCAVSINVSPVDGREEPMYCVTSRMDRGPCGPEARLFAAKPANPTAE